MFVLVVRDRNNPRTLKFEPTEHPIDRAKEMLEGMGYTEYIELYQLSTQSVLVTFDKGLL